jgi:hypothetical protein
MRARIVLVMALTLGLVSASALEAQDSGQLLSPEDAIGRTPARLSFVDGQVSFFRPASQDWVQAQVNMPLSPGDQLYTGSPGNLEIQTGARAFVRGWANTQIGLENHEPGYIQFKVTAGHAAFDLRTLESGQTLEVATPNAAFTIDRAGYYRVDVDGERTAFIARRGGRAYVTPADGEAFGVAPSEEVVIEGVENPKISSYSAPDLDSWDRWNYARSERLLDSVSARYVAPGIYGASDLDRHGRWRVVPEYGPVWVPTGVPPGWAPYSTGAWVHDPYYGWTWVDTAPWGWAPYHYGRWVHVGGFWGWAPGPVVVRPAYAPALVAFFGGPHFQVSLGIGAPLVGWVALGWGEPCVPWWGRPGFIHRPWWGGWGGPRYVNNVLVQHTTVVKVEEIHVYRNAHVHNAVVAVDRDRFGRGGNAPGRISRANAESLRPLPAGPDVKPAHAGAEPAARRGIRPPEKDLNRPVVATRPPHAAAHPTDRGERKPEAAAADGRNARIVPAPQPLKNGETLPRPPFGQSRFERRPEAQRTRQPLTPKSESVRRPEQRPEQRMDDPRQSVRQPPQRPERSERPEAAVRPEPMEKRAPASPAPAAKRIESPRSPERQLPGEPASRLSPNRTEPPRPQNLDRGDKPPQRPAREDPPADLRRPPKPSGDAPKQQRPTGKFSTPPGSAGGPS